jgi:hypothetical protein
VLLHDDEAWPSISAADINPLILFAAGKYFYSMILYGHPADTFFVVQTVSVFFMTVVTRQLINGLLSLFSWYVLLHDIVICRMIADTFGVCSL